MPGKHLNKHTRSHHRAGLSQGKVGEDMAAHLSLEHSAKRGAPEEAGVQWTEGPGPEGDRAAPTANKLGPSVNGPCLSEMMNSPRKMLICTVFRS